MIYSREEILAARAEMPQTWKRTARWRMGTEVDAVESTEATGLSNGGFDWTAQTALGSNFMDFDKQALEYLRTQLEKRLGDQAKRLGDIDTESLLGKMGIMVNGVPTHGALVLLGKASSDSHLAGLAPRIVFTRYDAHGQLHQKMSVRMPFATGIRRLVAAICAEEDYLESAVFELLVNAVAHCDYLKRGTIEVRDYHGTLSVASPGSWAKGSPTAVLHREFVPLPMRNAALCRILVQCGLMDALGLGLADVQDQLRKAELPQVSFYMPDDESVTAILYASVKAQEESRSLPPLPKTEAKKTTVVSAPHTVPDAAAKSEGKRATRSTAAQSAKKKQGTADELTSAQLKDRIVPIIREGHGLTRAEIVEELADQGISGEGEKFARRIGRLLDQLHKAGAIRKGEPDRRHWYAV
ncbi:MAG: ATP-binding protein [Eggerthellaceae bacterium]|jgi:ATP-dependent DNA helicase RecG